MSDVVIDKEVAAKMRRYEDIKLAIKDLEKEMNTLKPQIAKAMPDQVEIAGESGIFVIQKRPKWKFSPKVTEAEEALEKMQDEEIQKGIATATYSRILMYTAAKVTPPGEEIEQAA